MRESRAHVEQRAKEVLDMIFNDDKETCELFGLSTSHPFSFSAQLFL